MASRREIWRKLNQKSVYFGLLGFIAAIAISSGITYWLAKPSPPYPLAYEANFISSCVNAGDTFYGCVCPLRYVENNYSYKQALGLDHQIQKTHKLPRGLQQVFKDCRKNQSK